MPTHAVPIGPTGPLLGPTSRGRRLSLRRRAFVERHHLAALEVSDPSAYRRIGQRRDFYRWFYGYTAARGWQTRWPLAAAVVAHGAHELAHLPNVEGFASALGAVSNELQGAMRLGNQVIFEDVFPKLAGLLAAGPLRGSDALAWDMRTLSDEQELVQPLYDAMTPGAFGMMDRAARLGLLARIGGWRPVGRCAYEVGPGLYNRAGAIPPFQDPDLRCSTARWRYGMTVGAAFSPSETGWTPGAGRPQPEGPYRSGEVFGRLASRARLHALDAQLDNRFAADVDAAEVARLIGVLTAPERAEVWAGRSPDGWDYAERLRRTLGPADLVRAVTAHADRLDRQLDFLDRALSPLDWRRLRYDDLRPLLLAFPPDERRALGTDRWRPLFLHVSTDADVDRLTADLDLPPDAARAWAEAERRLI